MKKYLYLAVVSSLAVATASCSSDEAEEISVPTPVEFLGTWQVGCSISDASDVNSSYQTITDTISETEIRSEYLYYDDASCLNPSVPSEKILLVETTFTGDMTETSLGDAYNVNLNLKSRLIDGEQNTAGVGTTIYSIVLLLNNSLYYGDSTASANGIDPSNRYSTLDVGHEYVLQ